MSKSVGYCHGCKEDIPDNQVLDHIRLFHVAGRPEFYPDGEPIDYGDIDDDHDQ